jgi:hypothetical protein
MQKIYLIIIILISPFLIFGQNDISLKGVIDFDLVSAGYTGKAIHLVANTNISDLSSYGIGVANNANGGDGQEYTFPAISLSIGDQVLLARDSTAMSNYFDNCFSYFDVILPASNAISQNGNDAVELFFNGNIIETFGDVNVDGTGTSWEYLDSWAYKDPSGSVSFSGENWIFGGVGCTVGSITTQTSSCPYPLCASQSSINNFSIFNDTKLYPNPSSDFLFFDNNIKNVKIFDSIGKEITNVAVFDNMIEISGLSNGVYFLSAKNIKTTFIKK